MKFCLWVVLFVGSFSIQRASCQPEVTLVFEIDQDPEVYDQTMYGEPPQFAIWLESNDSGVIKTVHVTRRTGTGNFEGRVTGKQRRITRTQPGTD